MTYEVIVVDSCKPILHEQPDGLDVNLGMSNHNCRDCGFTYRAEAGPAKVAEHVTFTSGIYRKFILEKALTCPSCGSRSKESYLLCEDLITPLFTMSIAKTGTTNV